MAAESRGVIPITVTVTLEPKPGTGVDDGGLNPQQSAYPTPTPTVTKSVTPTPSGPPASATPAPTASITPTPSQVAGVTSNSLQQAQKLFDERFRVYFGFVGGSVSSQNLAGEKRRVGTNGIEYSTFTWKKWISLENDGVYNPYSVTNGYPANTPNPWSLKKWYQWGCRRFHLHNPFGMVPANSPQSLTFEIDQFVNARDGLTWNGQVLNTPCPWITNDFVNVFRALTTGTRGRLDQATWDSWTTGPNAWFNPSEPIDVIVYVGALGDPSFGGSYSTYIDRWEQYFTENPKAAEKRLRDSVAPFISAFCKIGFDAAVVAPGPVPGDNVSLSSMNRATQRGWWSFWKWLETKIGKNRIYVESHPFKKGTGRPNPYLGYNILADDDWSNSKCCPYIADAYGPHATSEMGDIEFIRCFWQNQPTRNPIVSSFKNGVRTLERYSFLENIDPSSIIEVQSEQEAGVVERRLGVANCCGPNHNYYWNHLYAPMIASHMLEKQNIRGEPNPQRNITRSTLMAGNALLQILPQAFPGDPRYLTQFGYRFQSGSLSFVQYLAGVIDKQKRSSDSVFL